MDTHKDVKIVLLIVSISAVIMAISSIISGTYNISPILYGIICSIALFSTYLLLKSRIQNLLLFFTFIFLAFYLIPTVQFYLYKSNFNYFTPSESFIQNESILAKEKLHLKLSNEDLDSVYKFFDTLTKFDRRFDTIDLPSKIRIVQYRHYGINSQKASIVISKNDSLTNEFTFTNKEAPFYKSDLQKGLKRHIEEQKYITKLIRIEKNEIPYSEFYIESITTFASDDIKPTRNLSKLLNGIQALCLVFLTTFIINSFGLSLTLKKNTP